MRRHLILAAALCVTGLSPAYAAQQFAAVSYHDVRDAVVADYDPDQYAISTANLAAHFRWLRDHGYTPVSIAQIRAASAGGPALPAKAILLTFDDGYRSHYTRVYPLLRAFRFPAVFSLVTSWMEAPAGADIPYGRERKTREDFLQWHEVREMAASGLAEFASHSHDMHKGVAANPQGNELPAAISRLHLDGRYENASEYRQRLHRDLARSVAVMERELSARPAAMTWPYGKYNSASLEIAERLGLNVNLTLDTGLASAARIRTIPRYLVQANPVASELAVVLSQPARPEIVRAAHVDLDYVFDDDPVQQEENLSVLLDRIRALQISHVFLQAFADPDADGAAEALYFPNRHMPVRADLFSRVAWQLKTRAEVGVFAWMPVLAFEKPGVEANRLVQEALLSGTRPDPKGESRLSPFDPDNRRLITEIYEDLAVFTAFDGLLFHDDARMNEYEDASAAGRQALVTVLGPAAQFAELPNDPIASQAWARHKQQTLTDFTVTLAAHVRRFKPELKTARNLFADTVLRPESELWLAQSFADALENYDYVALMAMPFLENRNDADQFLEQLARQVIATPQGAAKVIFELQSVDWRDDTPLDAAMLRAQMRRLQSLGIRHLAWYPDDFIAGRPELETLRQGASLAEYTHRRR